MIVLEDAQTIDISWREKRPVKNPCRLTPMDQSAHPSIYPCVKKTEILTQKGRFIMLRQLVGEVESEEESQVMH